MSKQTMQYKASSWRELKASFDSDALWIRLERTSNHKPIWVKVTGLVNFSSGAQAWFTCVTQRGTTLIALGECPRDPVRDPVVFNMRLAA